MKVKMKKALTIILLFITFIVIYFLQLNFFSWFTISGIMPNLFILFVLSIGLYAGIKMGTAFGIIFGFIIDILGNNVIGSGLISLGVIGFFGGYLEKNLSKDSKITVMIMVIVSTAVYEIFGYLYRGIILSANIEIWIFIKKLLIEIIYNTLLTIILYPLIRKVGYKIEGIFKNEQILTRYF